MRKGEGRNQDQYFEKELINNSGCMRGAETLNRDALHNLTSYNNTKKSACA
jgi:hypothetical protein